MQGTIDGLNSVEQFPKQPVGDKDENELHNLQRLRGQGGRNLAHETYGLMEAFRREGTARCYKRNSKIYSQGERVEFLYLVVAGCVRTYKLLADGRRQIVAFYLPGDVFDLEAGDEYTLFAESIAASKALVVRRALIFELARRDRALADELWGLTREELRRAQDHILLLVKSAQGRVAGFLMCMAHRASDSGAVQLPMWRHDIADYLGLTIETISRTLTQFQRAAAISLPKSRQIEIRSRAVLSRLNS